MKISAIWDSENICHLHRTRLPFTHLQQDFVGHEWELSLVDVSPDLDALWLYGAYKLENVVDILKLKRKGVKLIVGLDDNYWDFPAWRADVPADSVVATIEILTQAADHVIVTTDALAKRVGHLQKTTVAPNLTEVTAYRLKAPPEDDDAIRIMWAGSSSHKGDLAVVDEACCEILERIKQNAYGKRVDFFFVGYAPDKVIRDYWNCGVNFIKWVPLKEYWWTLNNIRPHITLAPLADCQFNHCKSAIRIHEAWAMHSAHIYSPVGEYDATNTDGITGLKASTKDEWVSHMDNLIRNRDLRENLALNGWNCVKEDWNWRSPNARKKWHPTIDKILRLKNKTGQPQQLNKDYVRT